MALVTATESFFQGETFVPQGEVLEDTHHIVKSVPHLFEPVDLTRFPEPAKKAAPKRAADK